MPIGEDTEVTNQYLRGNFKPVYDEIVADGLDVVGEIPADLQGHFLRIGPNPYYVPDMETYHVFNGDGMIHGIQFEKGAATYRNRFVDSDGLREEREAGHWIYPTIAMFGEYIARGEMPKSKNTGNTAMVYHNGQLYALMEGGKPYRINLPDLTTECEYDFDGKLAHNFTAHPKVDMDSGEMMTFGYGVTPPYLNYSVVNPEGEIVHTREITLPKPIMMHDCGITEHYTIFPDLPLIFDMQRLVQGESFVAWEPENGCRIGIVPRMGDDTSVRWFEIEESFLFHVSNAWEEDDEVVFQACRSNRGGIEVSDAADAKDQFGQLHEWRLNMTTGEVQSKQLDNQHYSDFCRINDNLMGRKNRYIYAARFNTDDSGVFNGELKYDNETHELLVHDFGEGKESGEAVFAPRVGAVDEDDGYVICFVYDKETQSSECHVIDAKRFTQEPVAKIKLPRRVPHGFHATWVPAT